MADVIFFGVQAVFAGTGIFFILLAVSSFYEKEIRAAGICLGFLLVWCLLWAFVISCDSAVLNLVIFTGALVAALVSLVRFFPGKVQMRDASAARQFDERDHMFARNNLKNHPDLADIYYQLRPENRSCDRQIHKKPDFGDPDQVYYDFYTTPCYEAAFAYLHQTIPAATGTPAGPPRKVDPGRICRIICDLVRFYGGCDTGFIKLAPHTS